MTDIPVSTAPSGPDTDERVAADALTAADAAALAAGCRVRPISALADMEAACRLFSGIWNPGGGNVLASTELLRSMNEAGGYVAGAFDSDADSDAEGELAGACLGFFGPPRHGTLHSHVAGVSARTRDRSVGFALKTHQRSWALRRGVTRVSWTFDPLVRRNAYFNIGKLAALPVRYLPNFYGRMDDGINGADDSDRLLVQWRLDDADVAAACHGRHRPAQAAPAHTAGAVVALCGTADHRPVSHHVSAPRALVAVPEDIEALRRSDPKRASAWRSALRDVLGGLLSEGWQVTGFDRTGWYIVEREAAQ